MGGKERRRDHPQSFPRMEEEKSNTSAQPLFTHITGSAFLCKYKSNGTDLGCFSLSCEDSLFVF